MYTIQALLTWAHQLFQNFLVETDTTTREFALAVIELARADTPEGEGARMCLPVLMRLPDPLVQRQAYECVLELFLEEKIKKSIALELVAFAISDKNRRILKRFLPEMSG